MSIRKIRGATILLSLMLATASNHAHSQETKKIRTSITNEEFKSALSGSPFLTSDYYYENIYEKEEQTGIKDNYISEADFYINSSPSYTNVIVFNGTTDEPPFLQTNLNNGNAFLDFDHNGKTNAYGHLDDNDEGLLLIKNTKNNSYDIITDKNSPIEKLKSIFSNKRDYIDESDEQFKNLYIWHDENNNEKMDNSEIKSLLELNINKIFLSYKKTNIEPYHYRDNIDSTFETSKFLYKNKKQGKIGAIALIKSPIITQCDPKPVPENIKALPNVHGYGDLCDLQQTMLTNPDLVAAVSEFKALPDTATQKEITDKTIQIMFLWAGIPKDKIDNIDQNKDIFINKIYGQEVMNDIPYKDHPSEKEITDNTPAWTILVNGVAARLLYETHSYLSDYFSYEKSIDAFTKTDTDFPSYTDDIAKKLEKKPAILYSILSIYKQYYYYISENYKEYPKYVISNAFGEDAGMKFCMLDEDISYQNNGKEVIISSRSHIGGQTICVHKAMTNIIDVQNFPKNGPIKSNRLYLPMTSLSYEAKIHSNNTDLIMEFSDNTKIIIKNQLLNGLRGKSSENIITKNGNTYEATIFPQFGIQYILFGDGAESEVGEIYASEFQPHAIMTGISPNTTFSPRGISKRISSIGFGNRYNITEKDNNIIINANNGDGYILIPDNAKYSLVKKISKDNIYLESLKINKKEVNVIFINRAQNNQEIAVRAKNDELISSK